MKIFKIILVLFFLFGLLFLSPVRLNAVGCGERCYSNPDCDAPCTYCKPSGGLGGSGTCTTPPTPTPTPRSNVCCSNPFEGRTGWRYNPKTKKCEAQVGLGTERRPIECSSNTYCVPTSDGAGECRTGGEIPTPPQGTTCGWPNLPCCQGGSGQAPYCTVGVPSDTKLANCVCLAYQQIFHCDLCGCESGVNSQKCPKCNPECAECLYGRGKYDDQGKGMWTALGCLPTEDLNDFVGWLLRNVIFVASGIAFLLMAFGALQIITSAGSPDKMKAGSELITSALSGLLLIILSLFLLKLIGVDILRIPGFGS